MKFTLRTAYRRRLAKQSVALSDAIIDLLEKSPLDEDFLTAVLTDLAAEMCAMNSKLTPEQLGESFAGLVRKCRQS